MHENHSPLKRWHEHLRDWLAGFRPQALTISHRERLLSSLGAIVALFVTGWISLMMLGSDAPWLIAPMGASAVLLFAVPASPLAQPWPVFGGNVLSAAVGVCCAQWIPEPALAAACAVGLAIALMFATRCLHPPGGAAALTAVVGGPVIHELGFTFVALPVALNSLLMVAVALLFNNALRAAYPHRPAQINPHQTRDALPSARLHFTREDLQQVLREQDELLDITDADLEDLFSRAELLAASRRYGDIRCRDIMSRDVIHVQPDTPVREAWHLLARHRIKALPVINSGREVVGIVSLHDFFVDRHAAQPRWPFGRVPDAFPLQRRASGDTPVGTIMSAPVRVAGEQQLLADLVPAFSDGGMHHMPVVDEQNQLCGMLTQSDMIAALFQNNLERRHAARRAGA